MSALTIKAIYWAARLFTSEQRATQRVVGNNHGGGAMDNSLHTATITAPSRTASSVLQRNQPLNEVALVHRAMPYRDHRLKLNLGARFERLKNNSPLSL